MHRQFGFPFGQVFGGPGPNQGGPSGPSQPPQGPPPGPPFGGGPGQPPFGGGGGIQLPPPPESTPSAQGASLFAVDPGSLYGCLYRYTWMRLVNGRAFWFYPVFIGRTSVAGYRWQRRRRRWVYTGFDTRQIASFQCV
ncbi:hypothetical protein SAMN05192559_10679 [Halobacillus karajensis]|uniref:hypothetical protein n=1 Tax=Halobacillus karajensis TaxID=195088 RepID=UPI0008A7A4FA|nr:hypothetical protein [Halobacillus karajensis]SEH95775.1 hypothetical protein SAMN05192559_10679 [Halobacillus karajensis]